MPKILHTADLHLGAGLVNLPDDKRKIRKKEQLSIVERLVSVARDNKVDLFLIAGDLFDGDNVSPDTIDYVVDVLKNANDIEFLISPGNHDPYIATSPYKMIEWPKNVHIFSKPNLEYIEFERLNTRVYGAAFVSHHCNEQMLQGFTCEPFDGCNIILIHGEYKGPNEQYNIITSEEVNNCGADYIALGHVHTRTDIEHQPGCRTSLAYCGTPEGHGFDECGTKGVYIGTIERESVRLEFLPTCIRKFESVTVVANSEMDESNLYNALVNTGNYSENDLVRVELVGELSAEVNDNKSRIIKEFEEWLDKKCFWYKFKDATTVAMDFDLSGNGYPQFSLISLFKSKIDAALEVAQKNGRDEEVQLIKRAYELGMKSLQGREIDI